MNRIGQDWTGADGTGRKNTKAIGWRPYTLRTLLAFSLQSFPYTRDIRRGGSLCWCWSPGGVSLLRSVIALQTFSSLSGCDSRVSFFLRLERACSGSRACVCWLRALWFWFLLPGVCLYVWVELRIWCWLSEERLSLTFRRHFSFKSGWFCHPGRCSLRLVKTQRFDGFCCGYRCLLRSLGAFAFLLGF